MRYRDGYHDLDEEERPLTEEEEEERHRQREAEDQDYVATCIPCEKTFTSKSEHFQHKFLRHGARHGIDVHGVRGTLPGGTI